MAELSKLGGGEGRVPYIGIPLPVKIDKIEGRSRKTKGAREKKKEERGRRRRRRERERRGVVKKGRDRHPKKWNFLGKFH